MRYRVLLSLWAVAIACVFGPSHALAQSATVTKVKGRQAVVMFPEGYEPEVGDSINLKNSSKGGPRGHTIAFTGSLSFLSNSQTTKSTMSLAAEGRYGWNMAEFEFGPIAGFSYANSEDRSARTFGGGGFFDFNFIPNTPGTELVYGAGADFTIRQSTTSTASVENSSSDMGFFGGLFAKWFLYGNFAFRGDGGFSYSVANQNNGTTANTSGVLVKLGLQVYF